MERIPHEKLIVTQLVKEHEGLYRIHIIPPLVPILSHMRSLRSFLPISLRSVLILCFHLRLGLPSGLPIKFTNQNFTYISHPSHACCMPWPSHPLHHPSNVWWSL